MQKPHAGCCGLIEARSLSQEPVCKKSSKKIDAGEPFSRMSPGEHLDEAKKALADGYKINADPTKTVWGRVNDARKHLNAIGPGSLLYISAQNLMRKTFSREKHIEHMCVNVANQLMVRQREMFTNELEHYYANRGMFVDVELSGPDKTSMKLTCSLFCEASIDKIADQTNFFMHLKKAGFKVVVLGDNEENKWTYKLGK